MPEKHHDTVDVGEPDIQATGCIGPPTRSTPTTYPNPPVLAASTPDSASSNTAASRGSAKQVVKQADLVLAMYLRGDAFTPEQKVRNFDYYEPITVRDSSLSACGQAVIAAEVGYLDLAYDYLVETAFTDLHDLHDNVSSGLHIAALAGAWMDCVAGFGGMRDYGGNLTFAPRLPSRLKSLSFRMVMRDSKIFVSIDGDTATYRLLAGEPIDLAHHGQSFLLDKDEPVTFAIPKIEDRTPPAPPKGCEPYRRGTNPDTINEP